MPVLASIQSYPMPSPDSNQQPNVSSATPTPALGVLSSAAQQSKMVNQAFSLLSKILPGRDRAEDKQVKQELAQLFGATRITQRYLQKVARDLRNNTAAHSLRESGYSESEVEETLRSTKEHLERFEKAVPAFDELTEKFLFSKRFDQAQAAQLLDSVGLMSNLLNSLPKDLAVEVDMAQILQEQGMLLQSDLPRAAKKQILAEVAAYLGNSETTLSKSQKAAVKEWASDTGFNAETFDTAILHLEGIAGNIKKTRLTLTDMNTQMGTSISTSEEIRETLEKTTTRGRAVRDAFMERAGEVSVADTIGAFSENLMGMLGPLGSIADNAFGISERLGRAGETLFDDLKDRMGKSMGPSLSRMWGKVTDSVFSKIPGLDPARGTNSDVEPDQQVAVINSSDKEILSTLNSAQETQAEVDEVRTASDAQTNKWLEKIEKILRKGQSGGGLFGGGGGGGGGGGLGLGDAATGGVAGYLATKAKSIVKAIPGGTKVLDLLGKIPGLGGLATSATGAGAGAAQSGSLLKTLSKIPKIGKLIAGAGLAAGGLSMFGGSDDDSDTQSSGGNTRRRQPAPGKPSEPMVHQEYSGHTLGDTSAKYESGRAGSSAIGWDDKGGTSYGKYQIASKTGTASEFLGYLEKSDPDAAAKLKAAGFERDQGRNGEATSVWRDLASQGRVQQAEHNFIRETHYEPQLQKLDPELRAQVDQNPALQDALWSRSVHTRNFASKDFNAAFAEQKAKGGDFDTNSFIDSVYDKSYNKFSGTNKGLVRDRLLNPNAERAQLKKLNQEFLAGNIKPIEPTEQPTAVATATPTPAETAPTAEPLPQSLAALQQQPGTSGLGAGGNMALAGVGATLASSGVASTLASNAGTAATAWDLGTAGKDVWSTLKSGGKAAARVGSKSMPVVGGAITTALDLAEGKDAGEAVSAGVGSGVGMVGGAKLGALGGAALGSVVPVVGTAAGAAVGGIIGGIAGSVGGEWFGRKMHDWFGKEDEIEETAKKVAEESATSPLASVAPISEATTLTEDEIRDPSKIDPDKLEKIHEEQKAATEKAREDSRTRLADSGVLETSWFGKDKLDTSRLAELDQNQLMEIYNSADLDDDSKAALRERIASAPITGASDSGYSYTPYTEVKPKQDIGVVNTPAPMRSYEDKPRVEPTTGRDMNANRTETTKVDTHTSPVNQRTYPKPPEFSPVTRDNSGASAAPVLMDNLGLIMLNSGLL